tara:strand:- start:1038 stop:1883 length:846 start_codon:yes stop_codon:yes gene_type:complete
MNNDLNKKQENKKKYYVRDSLLWIFLIIFIIFIANIQDEYTIIRHLLVFIVGIYIIFKFIKSFSVSLFLKEILLFIACILYLYRSDYTKNLYENYIGILICVNIFVMIASPLFDKNYHIVIQIALLSLLTPLDFGNFDENNFSYFTNNFIFMFILYYIFAKSLRKWSLLALLSIIPMGIFYNNNPWKYRVISLLIMILLYNHDSGLFISQYNTPKQTPFMKKLNFKSNHDLSDLLFKYNDWKNNKIYYIFVIINYLLLYNTFMNSENTIYLNLHKSIFSAS